MVLQGEHLIQVATDGRQEGIAQARAENAREGGGFESTTMTSGTMAAVRRMASSPSRDVPLGPQPLRVPGRIRGGLGALFHVGLRNRLGLLRKPTHDRFGCQSIESTAWFKRTRWRAQPEGGISTILLADSDDGRQAREEAPLRDRRGESGRSRPGHRACVCRAAGEPPRRAARKSVETAILSTTPVNSRSG